MNNHIQQAVAVTGLTCSACEKIVTKKLKAVAGVVDAVVSKDSGTAVISATRDIPTGELIQALADTHYHIITHS